MFRWLVRLIMIYIVACMIFGWGVPAGRFDGVKHFARSWW